MNKYSINKFENEKILRGNTLDFSLKNEELKCRFINRYTELIGNHFDKHNFNSKTELLKSKIQKEKEKNKESKIAAEKQASAKRKEKSDTATLAKQTTEEAPAAEEAPADDSKSKNDNSSVEDDSN